MLPRIQPPVVQCEYNYLPFVTVPNTVFAAPTVDTAGVPEIPYES